MSRQTATQLLNSNDVWTDSYYLSPTAAYAATAIVLGSLTYYGSLNAGGSYQQSVSETVPNGLSGNYYLIVIADSGYAVFELDQVSKIGVSSSPIQVVSEPADLVVSGAIAPASGQAGGGVLVDWTVANLGAGDTAVASWQDNVYADTGSTLTSNAILLGSYTHNGLLAAGASYSESQDVPMPISLSGPYNLFVVTNEPLLTPGETTTPPPPVYESNFNNDTSAPRPIDVVQTLANLETTSVSAPISVQAGGSYSVQWTVKNIGAGETSSNYWFDDVWISTRPTLGSGGNDVYLGDVYLGTVQHSNPLLPGGSYTVSEQVTAPASLTPGSYYFIVAVDRPVLPTGVDDTTTENLVYEINGAAQETASATTVTPGPELVASNVTAPSACRRRAVAYRGLDGHQFRFRRHGKRAHRRLGLPFLRPGIQQHERLHRHSDDDRRARGRRSLQSKRCCAEIAQRSAGHVLCLRGRRYESGRLRAESRRRYSF